MEAQIEPFDPKTASRDEWKRFHAYRRLRHEERDPEDPLVDDETVESFMRSPDPQSKILRFAVLNPDRPDAQIGWLVFETFKEDAPSYESNKHLAWIYPELLAPHRRRGTGRRMLEKAAALASEHNKSRIVLDSDEDDGKAFIEAIGAEVALRWRQNRLYLDEVDWEMVNGWAEEGAARNPDTSLQWVTHPIEDSLIEEYCELFTEVFNQMPFDDLDVGEFSFTPETVTQAVSRVVDAGGTWFAATTREANGDLSGLTEMGYIPDRETMISQYMTGVAQAYRGRGLGKWLKAAMVLKVRDEYPKVKMIVTGNATSNAAMLAINDRLGFKPYRDGVTAQITVQDLEAYLSR